MPARISCLVVHQTVALLCLSACGVDEAPSFELASSAAKADDGASGKRMRLVQTIRGNIAPKSIAYSGDGLFFAQNMMYRHTISVFDRSRRAVATISDSVRLADFGLPYPSKQLY